jgi:hypothetical protein
MSAARIKRRLKNLEQNLSAPNGGTFTLEELCRSRWRADKKDFLKLARETRLDHFVRQFELEDAERHTTVTRAAPRP